MIIALGIPKKIQLGTLWNFKGLLHLSFGAPHRISFSLGSLIGSCNRQNVQRKSSKPNKIVHLTRNSWTFCIQFFFETVRCRGPIDATRTFYRYRRTKRPANDCPLQKNALAIGWTLVCIGKNALAIAETFAFDFIWYGHPHRRFGKPRMVEAAASF